MGTENISDLWSSTETWQQSTLHPNAAVEAETEIWLSEGNTTRNTSLTAVVFTSTQEQVLNIVFVVILGSYSFLSQVSVIVTIVSTPSLHIPHFFIVLGMCVSDSLMLIIISIAIIWQHITGDLSQG